MIFSCDLGAVKPTPALFARVLARLGQRADQVLLIDDAPDVVQISAAWGFNAYRYVGPEALRPELVRYGLIPQG
jgi:HAD superfamily hydrolase (TIGR01509 family)